MKLANKCIERDFAFVVCMVKLPCSLLINYRLYMVNVIFFKAVLVLFVTIIKKY